MFARDDAEAAKTRWRKVADQFRHKLPKLAPFRGGGDRRARLHDLLPQHRTKLHSTNPIERLNGVIKRRTEVAGIFRGIVADRISTSKGSRAGSGCRDRTNRFAARVSINIKEGVWAPNGGYCFQSAAHRRMTAQTAATVADVEQRIIDLERKHLRHHSDTLAILSAGRCSRRDRLSSRRSRPFRAPEVACPPAQNIEHRRSLGLLF
ncbi:transposase [Bradyrhizobium canariense]|uniref:transposase n=1 Tax=Bradyrhizobium canariense TaxID=255045 RepID=UPI003D9B0F0D